MSLVRVSRKFSCTHAKNQAKTGGAMKPRPSNLIPFAPFDGVPPLHNLDQNTIRMLRKLADQTGWTVEGCIRQAVEEFVAKLAAEEELETKIIAFRETRL